MHIVQSPTRARIRVVRRMNLPYERVIVNDAGLGGFKIGKMFKNAVKFTPRSFQLKNVLGTIGSGIANFYTLGMASAIAPKTFSAHSKTMRTVGTVAAIVAGTVAGGVGLSAMGAFGGAAGAAGAAGTAGAAAGAGGSILGTLGTATSLLSAGSTVLKMVGGKGGGAQQAQQYEQLAQQYSGPMPQQVVPQVSMYDPSQLPSAQTQVPGMPNYGMQNTLFPSMGDNSPGPSFAPTPESEMLPTTTSLVDPSVVQLPSGRVTQSDNTMYYYVGGVAALGLLYYIVNK